MTKNPYLNAIMASAYIVVIVEVIQYVTRVLKGAQESILIPMVMLSLFVCSAALMGFLFVSEPAKLFLDGKRDQAVTFFFKTLGLFAVFTIALLALLLR
jgi:hypothetical protein